MNSVYWRSSTSKMKLLQVSIFFLVLWCSEVKSHDAECSLIEEDTCFNSETNKPGNCLGCIVKHLEISPDNDVVTILPKFKNGSHAEIMAVDFFDGHVTSFPMTKIDDKKESALTVSLFETKTTVINAEFFGDKALNLQRFTSTKNSLTIDENSFVKATNLRVLVFLFSNITDIPSKTFFGLKKLRFLSIQVNSLEHIDPIWFTDLQNLVELDFYHNKISLLDSGVFDKLTNLEKIFLHMNEIETIPSDLFKNNVKLTEINLEHNKIKHIGNGVFAPLKHLTHLILDHNICVNESFEGPTLLSDAEKRIAPCY